MPGVWVTAGAPLQTGDGWRVWYSWPGGEFTPGPPTVRTPAGVKLAVADTAWQEWAVPGSRRRTGVLEVTVRGATPGALYEVTLPERDRPLHWRTLPAAPPLTLLIGSCFWLNDDKAGFYSSAVRELVQRERPAFKVLMGDQIYTDVWAPKPVRVDQGLAGKYERYWGDAAYQELLAACPTLVSCDDHEFWNDFPEPQKHIPYSWNSLGGPANGRIAGELYDAYQAALNPGGERWARLDVPPVSFFVADTRSNRTREKAQRPALMLESQWAALETWGRGLTGPGVLVLPQPLLKAGKNPHDRTLVDFPVEADRLAAVFQRALGGETKDRKPHDILILTGDIHTGRLSSAEIVGLPGEIHEFVASPASMVTPFIKPLGHKPEPPPEKLPLNGKTWAITAHRRLSSTVDNNVGVIRVEPGRNGRTRFTLQLWRVRPYAGLPGRVARAFKPKPAKGAVPIHDPLELELR